MMELIIIMPTRTLSNHDIARVLNEVATYYDMEGVPFKPRAYEKVALSIEALDREVADLYQEGGAEALRSIPNVGEGLAAHIELLLKKGTFPEYKRLKKKIPVKLDELTGIEGLGPKSIKTLYEKLRIKNLADLERAAKTHKIRALSHFGEKSEEKIVRGIEFLKKSTGRFLLGYIDQLVHTIEERLKQMPGVGQVTTAGSYRRRQETIGDIDILVSVKPISRDQVTKRVMETFVNMPEVAEVLAHGKTKSMVRLSTGIQADVRVLPEKFYGAALQYFTGSKDHNVLTRKIAIAKGLKLNEYGVFKNIKLKMKNEKWVRIAGKTEKEVYNALGLVLIPPELRTASGEIEAARQNFLQQRKKLGGQARGGLPDLISYGSIRGDLQVQTNWTDGHDTIEVMAQAAADAGLEYIAITDHTRALAMTGGLDEKGLARQAREINKINARFHINGSRFQILKSAEVNVFKDGKLDIADEALRKLDIICVAVHSHFTLSEQDQTERIIRAIKHPLVNILFHPTGRVIQKREPYAVNIDKIVRAASLYGVALEANAYPDRLDLKDAHIRKAIEAGVKLIINSDAHSTLHFKFLDLGVAQARRGWATAKDVLNTLPCEKFLKTLKGLKKK